MKRQATADGAALRDLPSVDRLLRAPGGDELVGGFGRSLATEALRAERDAAFRMSRCECASDECCANLVKHQQRAERLAGAVRRVIAAFRAHGEASSFTREAERTQHECEAAMLSLDAALRDHDQEAGNG